MDIIGKRERLYQIEKFDVKGRFGMDRFGKKERLERERFDQMERF